MTRIITEYVHRNGSQLLAGPQPGFLASMAGFQSPSSETVLGSMAAFEGLWRPQFMSNTLDLPPENSTS
jgi:hypothetical protein